MQLASEHLPVEFRNAIDCLASDIIKRDQTPFAKIIFQEDGTEIMVSTDDVQISYVISGPTILHGGCKLLED